MKILYKHHYVLTFLLILVLVVYFNSFNNQFVSDDISEILKNPNIGDFKLVLSHTSGFIRPLLYFLIFHIFGLNPFGFRLINILFHSGSVALLFLNLNRLYNKRVALYAAVLFAVHPLLSETIVWISGGSYVQYTFFTLLTWWFWQSYLKTKQIKNYLLTLGFFFLTMQSHTTMTLAIFFILVITQISKRVKLNLLAFVPFLLLFSVYLYSNFQAIPERETTLHTTHYQERGVDNPLIQVPVAITSYLELFVWPQKLTFFHSELAFSSWQFVLRAFITILLVVLTAVSFWAGREGLFFWLAWFFIGLSPTLTPFRLNWIVAERYVYFSSIAIFALSGISLERVFQTGKKLIFCNIIFALAIFGLSLRTIIRNIDWKNEDNLWIATGQTSPSSPNNHNNLGDVYGRHGDKQRAILEFQTAISLKPNYGDAYHNLANAYQEIGKNQEAKENYLKAVIYNPNLWQSYQNLAAIEYAQGNYDQAIDYLKQALRINGQNSGLYSGLGVVYLAKKSAQEALSSFNTALELNPQNQQATIGLDQVKKLN